MATLKNRAEMQLEVESVSGSIGEKRRVLASWFSIWIRDLRRFLRGFSPRNLHPFSSRDQDVPREVPLLQLSSSLHGPADHRLSGLLPDSFDMNTRKTRVRHHITSHPSEKQKVSGFRSQVSGLAAGGQQRHKHRHHRGRAAARQQQEEQSREEKKRGEEKRSRSSTKAQPGILSARPASLPVPTVHSRSSAMSTSGGEMSTEQLFQQAALLRWLSSQTEDDRRLLAALTGVQVGRELLNRLTGRSQVDAFKRECILGIAEFVRQNPRASQADINAEVEKRVLVFAARVGALEATPLF